MKRHDTSIKCCQCFSPGKVITPHKDLRKLTGALVSHEYSTVITGSTDVWERWSVSLCRRGKKWLRKKNKQPHTINRQTQQLLKVIIARNTSVPLVITDLFGYLFLPTWLLVVEQQLHGPHHLFPDGVQQGITHVHVEVEQQLDDLQVLILDGDEQGRAPQGVDAVDVDPEVDLSLLQGLLDTGVVPLLHGPQVGPLKGGELRLGPHDPQRDAVPVRGVVSFPVVQL